MVGAGQSCGHYRASPRAGNGQSGCARRFSVEEEIPADYMAVGTLFASNHALVHPLLWCTDQHMSNFTDTRHVSFLP